MITRRKLSYLLILTSLLFIGNYSYADAASAIVTPATGGNGAALIFGHAEFDLGEVGYTQSEYFLQGTADAYEPAAELTPDGRWSVVPVAPASYKTRILVNRPIHPKKFSGTVIVEWFNVSGLADATPEWQHQHVEILRKGHIWVGVSAQWHGISQLQCDALGQTCPELGDPERYNSLFHPGDSWSYDIYSQAGQAVRDQYAELLGGLKPRRLIAVGESQSAGRLTTYINAVHPLVDVYDGFIVHSRGASGSALSQSTAGRLPFPQVVTPDIPTPTPSYFRDDMDVPVLAFQAENDLGGLAARQPDNDYYRLWEVAGTAHFDMYGLVQAANDTGDKSTVAAWFDSMQNPTSNPSTNFACALPINAGPATFVMRAALRSMDRWVKYGIKPPVAPRFEADGSPAVYATDENGNVLGGIRTPAVDVPIATLNGLGQPTVGGGQFCFLFGVTAPFSEQKLQALYKSHGRFVAKWSWATRKAVKEGFLLREDARNIRRVAAKSSILKKPHKHWWYR